MDAGIDRLGVCAAVVKLDFDPDRLAEAHRLGARDDQLEAGAVCQRIGEHFGLFQCDSAAEVGHTFLTRSDRKKAPAGEARTAGARSQKEKVGPHSTWKFVVQPGLIMS